MSTDRIIVGSTVSVYFTLDRQRADRTWERYNPASLKVSFLYADGSEQTLVYGGSETFDDDVVRLSVGEYQVTHVVTVVGDCRVRLFVTDNAGAKTWPVKETCEAIFEVIVDPHTYTDRAAPPA